MELSSKLTFLRAQQLAEDVTCCAPTHLGRWSKLLAKYTPNVLSTSQILRPTSENCVLMPSDPNSSVTFVELEIRSADGQFITSRGPLVLASCQRYVLKHHILVQILTLKTIAQIASSTYAKTELRLAVSMIESLFLLYLDIRNSKYFSFKRSGISFQAI